MREACCRPCVTAGMNAPKANASGNTFLKDSFQRLKRKGDTLGVRQRDI